MSELSIYRSQDCLERRIRRFYLVVVEGLSRNGSVNSWLSPSSESIRDFKGLRDLDEPWVFASSESSLRGSFAPFSCVILPDIWLVQSDEIWTDKDSYSWTIARIESASDVSSDRRLRHCNSGSQDRYNKPRD